MSSLESRTEDLLPADVSQLPVGKSTPRWAIQSAYVYRWSALPYMLAWVALFICGTSLWWMLGWLQPPNSVRLSLLGAGYETNLTVPHNAFGLATLNDLSQLPQARPVHARWRLAEGSRVLSTDRAWLASVADTKETSLMIYITGHVGVDQQGPFLIANDATPSAADARLRLDEILKRLANLPAHVDKVVMLDVGHATSNPHYGGLSNGFPQALRERDDAIVKIPNLIVINACDLGQVSHVSHTLRRTVFGHIVTEGLKGAATDRDGDGRLDALDFFQFVRAEVVGWGSANRNVAQTPILLPLGEEGVQRARRVDLRIAQVPYEPSEVSAASAEELARIEKVWTEYEELREQEHSFIKNSPALWRAYGLAVRRFEALVHAGAAASSRLIEERVRSMRYQLKWEEQRFALYGATSLALNDVQGALSSLRDGDAAQQTIAKVSAELWNAAPEARQAVWERTVLQLADQKPLLRLCRRELFRSAYERASLNPSIELKPAAEVAKIVCDPLIPLPVEIHFLTMLAECLPLANRGVDDAPRIGRALQIKQLAEQVAASQPEGELRGLACEVMPWIEPAMGEADNLRRQAEDLLFADRVDRQQADQLFDQAEKRYREVQLISDRITSAFANSRQALADMDNFRHWIYSVAQNVGLEDTELLLKRHESMCGLAIDILSLCQTTPERDAASQPRIALPAEMLMKFEQLSELHSSLKVDFEQWWQIQCNSRASDWTSLNEASQTTVGAFSQRIALYDKLREFESPWVLNSSAGLSDSDGAGRFSDSATGLQVGQQIRGLAPAKQMAAVRGKLALAAIGRSVFDGLPFPSPTESFAQVLHRLEVMPVDSQWDASLISAGEQIALRLNYIDASPGKQNDVTKAVAQSVSALVLARELHCGGADGTVPSASAVLERQMAIQSDYLAWLAERVELDHWYEPGGEKEYFKEVAESLLQMASRMWPENPSFAAIQERLDAPAMLELLVPQSIDVTTEQELSVPLEVAFGGPTKSSPGYAVLTTDIVGSGLRLLQPTAGRPRSHRLTANTRNAVETIAIANPSADLTLPFASTQFRGSRFVSEDSRAAANRLAFSDLPSTLQIQCFYRGRRIEKSLPLILRESPTIVTTSPVRPRGAQLSVRASKKLHQTYGNGSGSIAFVLDASGSMGAMPGQAFDATTKYHQATKALEQVLSGLPDGVRISVWVFGQASGPQKTVQDPATTIRRVVPLQIWNSDDSGQLPAIIKSIQYPNIEPWNESPVVAAILTAKQDLQGVEGFKSVVVITDGVDSRQTNHGGGNGQDIELSLRQAFDGSDIMLNVVGFRVAATDEAAARKLFQVTESFQPAGRFVESSHVEELAEILKNLLFQRIHYWVDDYADAELTSGRVKIPVAATPEDDAWYPTKLAPGTYHLWSTASRRPTRISLNSGDRLIVELDERDGEVLANRINYLGSDLDWKPTVLANGWQATTMENRVTGRGLELLIGFEKLPTLTTSMTAQPEPAEVWIEATPSNSSEHRPVHLSQYSLRSYGFPMPTFQLVVEDWPLDVQRLPLPGQCKVWFNPDRSTPPGLRIQRGRDYNVWTELQQRTWELHASSIGVDEVKIEERKVSDSDGVVSLHSCLVVRTTHAPDKPLWVRPMGLQWCGEQHVHYGSIGKSTAMFWPVDEEQLLSALNGLEFVALEDLKEHAEANNNLLTLPLTPASSDGFALPPLADRPRE